MKRLIPLFLALVLLLTACGTPSPSPTPYPASPQDLNTLPEPTVDPRIPQEPAVLAGPADEGYTFTSDTQHFSIEISDEAAPYVVICDGLTGYYPVGEAVSFCFYSYKMCIRDSRRLPGSARRCSRLVCRRKSLRPARIRTSSGIFPRPRR